MLSSLQGLLVLSMRMSEGADQPGIVDLAVSAVPSLVDGRLEGVYLKEDGWQRHAGDAGLLGAVDLEAQCAVLSSAGGPLAVQGRDWGWAYPLRSFEGHLGFLVISSAAEPPAEQQFLLRVLAQQSGIALSNATLHDRERARASELAAANAELESSVSALQRSTSTHAVLTRVAVNGEGAAGIARAVHELTGHPALVQDEIGHPLAAAGSPIPDVDEAAVVRADRLARCQQEGHPLVFDGMLLAAATAGSEVLGSLTLFDPEGTAGEHETTVLEHGATVLAMELVRLKSLIEVELRLGRDVVDELLSGSPTERTIAQAMGLGFEPHATHRVGVLAASGPFDALNTAAAIRRFEGVVGPGPLTVEHRQTVVLLTRSDCDFRALIESLDRKNARVDFRIGLSSPCDDVDRLPRAHREAEVALRMFDLARATGGVAAYEELGVFQLLAEIENRGSIERFVHTWLGRLVDYDADHGSSLVETLSAYLALGGAYNPTARALAVHRSTLKYRLHRIREISGHDLTDADVRFNLELASRARQTLRAIWTASPGRR
jgi:hypothetical protein